MKLGSNEVIKLIQTHPVSVVTSINEEGVCNAAAFSWLSPVSFDPPMMAIMVSPERYPYSNLEETNEFVVNIITKHFLEEMMKVGTESFSENPNKLDESDFNLEEAKKAAPKRIKEAVAWVECKVKDMIEAGDHSIVIGEIITAEVEDDFWKEGRFQPEKAETLQHLGGNEFIVGGEYLKFEE